jgi:pyridoxal phosphate enzyme (YggS family)
MIQDTIKQNLEKVEEKIAQAVGKSGRRRGDVRLIVVSKGQSVEKMEAAYQCGARYFGENYPEETAQKIPLLTGFTDVEWHMIGHLQSRKAKLVVDAFHMLHSLDSLHTAEKLERLLAEKGRVLPVLIEVNTGGEESKSGLTFTEIEKTGVLYPFIEALQAFPHLVVHGLMTMPPLWEDPEKTRPYFARLRMLRDDLAGRYPGLNWKELSMGTSADYEAAISEGSTMVRVGSAILGERVYK